MKKTRAWLWFLACVLCVGILSMKPAVKTQASGSFNLITTVTEGKTPAGKWVKNKKGYRYRYTYNKKYAKKIWLNIKGKIYYFNKNGYRVTGFKKYKGNWYYLNKNGVLKKGWVTIQGNKYYFSKKTGAAKTGICSIGKQKYRFDEKGKMLGRVASEEEKIIFVGDSRTQGMKDATGSSDVYIAKVGEGYYWLNNTAVKSLKEKLEAYPKAKVIFNLGVNDLGNVQSYISWYKNLMKSYPETAFYFVSVNPIEKKLAKNKGYNVTYVNNTKIKAFNAKIKAAFPTKYIDSYTYLSDNGYFVSQGKGTVDGIHYTTAVSKVIYQYVIDNL